MHLLQMNFPFWLNGDVIVGPGGTEEAVIDPYQLIPTAQQYFPTCTLSTGFTTGVNPSMDPATDYRYTMGKNQPLHATIK